MCAPTYWTLLADVIAGHQRTHDDLLLLRRKRSPRGRQYDRWNIDESSVQLAVRPHALAEATARPGLFCS